MSDSKNTFWKVLSGLAIVVLAIVVLTSVFSSKNASVGGDFHSTRVDFAQGISVNGTTVISNTGAITSTAGLTSSSATAGVGYATGAGCSVTQLTNRTTGVTCTGVSGQITTNNASLAAETAAEFTVTDTSVAIGDVVNVAVQSGTNGGATDVLVSTVANGSFKVKLINDNAAAGTAETGAVILNFAVMKAVAL